MRKRCAAECAALLTYPPARASTRMSGRGHTMFPVFVKSPSTTRRTSRTISARFWGASLREKTIATPSRQRRIRSEFQVDLAALSTGFLVIHFVAPLAEPGRRVRYWFATTCGRFESESNLSRTLLAAVTRLKNKICYTHLR